MNKSQIVKIESESLGEKLNIELRKCMKTLPTCDWCEKHFLDEELFESANSNGIDVYFCSPDCESKFVENESANRSWFGEDEDE